MPMGTVVLQSGLGEDVVIRIEPLPVAELVESNRPFSMIVAATPGEVTLVVSWNVFPTIGWGGSIGMVANASRTPQAGPANPTWSRVNALSEMTHLNVQR
jgi:hypothetical protein